jgi:hypothetical protein
MAAISDNKYDVHNWIEKVIDSCTTYFHFKSVDALITNFDTVYDDWELTGKLRVYLTHKNNKRYNEKRLYKSNSMD